MIPVLGCPVLNRYDLLANMEASVDHEVQRYFVVDNGGLYDKADGELSWAEGMHVCDPGYNMGFGAALNLVIRANIKAPWWMFVNDDIVFGRGDLARMDSEMSAATGPVMRTLAGCGFSAFAINAAAVERVGWFDENFYPAYCEDSDWSWRAILLGVEWVDTPSSTSHLSSQTIAQPTQRAANNRTYPQNRILFRQKWGCEPWEAKMEGPGFKTPFASGLDPSITIDPPFKRLKELAWDR
jgi:GT2 family glycosyltransferase